MKRIINLLAVVTVMLCVGCSPKVDFTATTLPYIEGVDATVDAVRNGNEWDITVVVENTLDRAVDLRVALVAEPGFKADAYLFPGINYNGNGYGSNLDLPQSYGDSKGFIPFPQGWEYEGKFEIIINGDDYDLEYDLEGDTEFYLGQWLVNDLDEIMGETLDYVYLEEDRDNDCGTLYVDDYAEEVFDASERYYFNEDDHYY